jgi:hypothetical protein
MCPGAPIEGWLLAGSNDRLVLAKAGSNMVESIILNALNYKIPEIGTTDDCARKVTDAKLVGVKL